MGKAADKALEDSMRKRRPPASVALDVSQTIFGQMSEESQPAIMICLDRIVVSPFQSRANVDDSHIETLMESIGEKGLWNPVIVRPLSDSDKYELVAGHNRFEAFVRLERPEIPARVRQLSDQEAALVLTGDNALHKQLTDWEQFKHIEMLESIGAVSDVPSIAKALECSRAQIYNLRAFGLLPQGVKKTLDQMPDLISGTVAYAIRKYSTEHPQYVQEAIELVETKKLKQSGMVAWLERKTNPRSSHNGNRKELSLTSNDRTLKVVLSDNRAQVTGDFNVEKLRELIESHLDSLTQQPEA